MTTTDILQALGLILTIVGLVSAIVWRVRSDLKKDVDEVKSAAKEANEKAHAVEVTMARDYVSRMHLDQMIQPVRMEMQAGFQHLNSMIEKLWSKES